MEYLIISLASLAVAALTFFSGFGLGTLLMPVFALFFPVELAVAATAIVHLANNIFKAILVGRNAVWKVVLKFAVPASIFAMVGALLLGRMSGLEPLAEYTIGPRVCAVTPVKLVISVLIFAFALFELVPKLKSFSLNPKWVPFGGALSGFFGGLSGHQGALRTAFLIKLGLTKEAFIGTVVVSAVIVDIFRIGVYGVTFVSKDLAMLKTQSAQYLVLWGIVAAFVGSLIGRVLLRKITMHSIQIVIGIMLILLAVGLGTGMI
jgi:uncharacterized membrane protein YfcA